jgi:hypothetical protein
MAPRFFGFEVFMAAVCFSTWALLVVANCATAQNPGPALNVKVTVVVILASEEGSKIDPKLKAIAEEVRIKYPNLTSFQLKSMASKSLPPDEKAQFPLVDDKNVAITIKHGADTEKRVSLAVVAPDQGEIVYRCVCGKFLPIVTRYQTHAGELLILAIRTQPCKDE